MSLKVRHDFLNQPYVEGDVGGKHIIGERYHDLITGEEFWNVDDDSHNRYVVTKRRDFITGEEALSVEPVEDNTASGFRALIGLGLLIFCIVLIPAAGKMVLGVWHELLKQNIPELDIISVGSVVVVAFMALAGKGTLGFGEALGGSVACISLLFFLAACTLTFIIPTPAMKCDFSLIAFFSIGLISFVASLGPAVIIAILSLVKKILTKIIHR